MLDFLKHYWTLNRRNKAELVLVGIATTTVLAALITIFIKVPGLAIAFGFTIAMFSLIRGVANLTEAYDNWKRKNPHR